MSEGENPMGVTEFAANAFNAMLEKFVEWGGDWPMFLVCNSGTSEVLVIHAQEKGAIIAEVRGHVRRLRPKLVLLAFRVTMRKPLAGDYFCQLGLLRGSGSLMSRFYVVEGPPTRLRRTDAQTGSAIFEGIRGDFDEMVGGEDE